MTCRKNASIHSLILVSLWSSLGSDNLSAMEEVPMLFRDNVVEIDLFTPNLVFGVVLELCLSLIFSGICCDCKIYLTKFALRTL